MDGFARAEAAWDAMQPDEGISLSDDHECTMDCGEMCLCGHCYEQHVGRRESCGHDDCGCRHFREFDDFLDDDDG